MSKDQSLAELSAEFENIYDFDSLASQLQSVVDSKDPITYMQNNINWEIDNNIDNTNSLSLSTLFDERFAMEEMFNPFRRFLNWLRNSNVARKVKGILCDIGDRIKELIDEEAELKKILGVAITAIIAALGAGAINPVLLTILVGFLATMILKGVADFCAL